MSSENKAPDIIARAGKKKVSPTQLDRPPSVKPGLEGQISVSNLPRCFLPTEGILRGVAARNSSDIWAVGQGWDHPKMDMTRPLTMHWDGKCWSEYPCPNMGLGAELQAVCVVPPDGAIAVGRYADNNQLLPPPVPFAVRWDPNARQWVPIIPNRIVATDYYISGVSGTSGQDVWLVGNTIPQAGGPSQTHVQHWDGNAWAVVPRPNVNAQLFNSLIAVTALTPNLAFAVGQGNGNETMVQRWDGKLWKIVSSPNAPDTRQLGWNCLSGVAATSAKSLCAVGTYTPEEKPWAETLILESQVIDQWRIIAHPPFAGVQELDRHELYGVALDPAGGAWAAGNVMIAGNVNVSHPLVLHRDKGGPWTVMTDKPKGSAGGLAGVTAVTKSDVWAVGWYHDPNFKWPFCLLEHWDGNNWRSFP